MKKLIYIFLFTFTVSCSTNNTTEEFERTYPLAFNLETTTLPQLFNDVSPPDSLNISVFVNNIFLARDCTDVLSLCIGDAISVSIIVNPSEGDPNYISQVDEPRQFKKGEQYTMSFKVKSVGSEGGKSIELIGYSFANQIIDDF